MKKSDLKRDKIAQYFEYFFMAGLLAVELTTTLLRSDR